MTAPTPLVAVRGLTRRYGDQAAVDDVSFDINDNEFFALLGPSGCGKSTLLRILAGLDFPSEGSVTLDGVDLVAMPPHRRPVNLMFQSYALFPHLTVAKNVAYGLERERRPKNEIRERVAAALTTVGLEGLDGRRPNELSGGQQQRVALARAMVKRPRLLLLDEPLAALDRKIRAQMQLELKTLQAEVGITFVIVTHDQEEAMSMADRVAVMNQGRIEQIAPPVELYERPASLFVADFIGSSNRFAGTVDDVGITMGNGLTIPADTGDRPSGAHTTLCLRPESIRLGDDGAPADGGSGVVRLRGRVLDVAFYGGVSHCVVKLPDLDSPLLVAVQGSTQQQPGSDVIVWWRSDDMVVLDQ